MKLKCVVLSPCLRMWPSPYGSSWGYSDGYLSPVKASYWPHCTWWERILSWAQLRYPTLQLDHTDHVRCMYCMICFCTLSEDTLIITFNLTWSDDPAMRVISYSIIKSYCYKLWWFITVIKEKFVFYYDTHIDYITIHAELPLWGTQSTLNTW